VRRGAILRFLGGALGLLVGLAACGATATDAPTGTLPPSAGPTEPVVDPTQGFTPPPAEGQTDTEWGRIWDVLPAGFPAFPGGSPTETREGPVTAEFYFDAPQDSVMQTVQTILPQGGLQVGRVSVPVEDGTQYIDTFTDDPECLGLVEIGPQGAGTLVRLFYGVGCPSE
jgi:hypothetical protein